MKRTIPFYTLITMLVALSGFGISAAKTWQNQESKLSIKSTWPAPPLATPSLLADTGLPNRSPQPLASIEYGKAGPLANDPLEQLSADNLSGTLVYIPRIAYPGDTVASTFFTFQSIERSRAFTVSYPLRTLGYNQAYNPRFSPSGDRIMFSIGDSEGGLGSHQICFWDFRSRRLLGGPRGRIIQQRALWSPDGQYVAYTTGGDQDGFVQSMTPPIRLFVYDVIRGINKLIAEDPSASSFTWTPKGTLLYEKRRQKGSKHVELLSPDDVDIYEAYTDGHPSLRLIPDASEGYFPAASQDGRWVAYVGWLNIKNGIQVRTPKAMTDAMHSAFGVCVFDRLLGKSLLVQRLSLNADVGEYAQLIYASHGQLLIIRTTYRPERGNTVSYAQQKGIGQAEIWCLAVSESATTARHLASIPAQDYHVLPRYGEDVQFKPMHVTEAGRCLLMNVSEFIGVDDNMNVERRTLLVIDLRDGQVKTLARILNKWWSVVGLDWLDGPLPSSQTLNQPISVRSGIKSDVKEPSTRTRSRP